MPAPTSRQSVGAAVVTGRLFVSQHARKRLCERSIPLWQITSSLPDGKPWAERPDDRPHPAVEIRQTLPDGTDVKAVRSFDAAEGEARLVTVHYFDRSIR